ncbi:uncharacterized protein NECHADRAFT_82680 [Fusarium vanettenii 77-13-4]|uniref:FMN hydroxy acid dehydrogenase domain-containing protein n=1 Tax=Fusarium vanettenii (strain ATCC MYA-4622 / CBS 123669 / FGSC 9596 / NRRL 45880 / 77-13-4) TaxID=660122 RepID=C7YXX3_FUSV7|nr:uncharacterized protein NECHADRAFT_82680 [Fusarium vanettenii 77-13-4]EEU43668.1 hypothetical protein NECHADRAFT_82680 [Fusarium vanettenii 77-13-4]
MTERLAYLPVAMLSLRHLVCPQPSLHIMNPIPGDQMDGLEWLDFKQIPRMTWHGHIDPGGEVATSRATAKKGVAMALSSYSSMNLEDVAAESQGNPYMIHVCFYKDRRKTLEITKRAETAGFKAVLVSVDIPVLGIRPNEHRNNWGVPEGITMPMLADENGIMHHDADYLKVDPAADADEVLDEQ